MPEESEKIEEQQQPTVETSQSMEKPEREPFIDVTIYIERALNLEELIRK